MAALPPVADVRVGRATESVDLAVDGSPLGDAGHRCAVVEGGAVLNGQLVAAGLVDELCLTWRRCSSAGRAGRRRIDDRSAVDRLRLAVPRTDDGCLLAGYVRRLTARTASWLELTVSGAWARWPRSRTAP